MNQKGLKKEIEMSDGYIFPSFEPFGIAPVEALAAGCPVIAYGKGGSLDYVEEGKNGIFFEKQTANSLSKAIRKFKTIHFDADKVMKSAEQFDEKIFTEKLRGYIYEKTRKN